MGSLNAEEKRVPLKTGEEKVSEFKLSFNGCGTSSLLVLFLFPLKTDSFLCTKCRLAKFFQFFDG